MNQIAVFCLCLIFLSSSCSRETCSDPESIAIRISGFDSTEFSNAVYRKFTKGSNFKGVLKTDTVNVRYEGNYDYYIDASHDWTLELPNTQKTYLIDDIHFTKNKGPRRGIIGGEAEACTNNLAYTINGVELTYPGNDYAGDSKKSYVEIKK